MTDLAAEGAADAGVTDAPAPPEVRLAIPAQARYLRLARLTAAGLAGDLGFGVDDIEDLRVAIDELCAAVIEGAGPGSELVVRYQEVDGAVVARGTCDDREAPAPELHRVARELLTMLADEHEIGSDGSGRTFRLVKRPRSGR